MAVAALASLLAACSSAPMEAVRTSSPDGIREAIVLEGGVNATTPYNYTVCIVEKGKSCKSDNMAAEVFGATRSEHAYGIDLIWRDPTTIEVRYLTANRAQLMEARDRASRGVVIVFKSGVENANAPDGAMMKGS